MFIWRTSNAISAYNDYVNAYNKKVSEYNKKVVNIDVQAIGGMPTSYRDIKIENEDVFSSLKNIFKGNGFWKISKDCKTLKEITDNVDYNINVLDQINAPQESWVEQRLRDIQDINEIAHVSKNEDPDMMLGKEGGYLSCTYFSLKSLDNRDIPGNSLIDKGTDAGGAIEVYLNKADADAREKYLAGFDNTLLYSGSHVVVGTSVVRTSYMLTDQQQVDLTDKIIKAFTQIG